MTGRLPDLGGRKVVVTAGGTIEPIDPVRVITNLSTGKMGNAIAAAAVSRGADVVLISSAADPTIYGVRHVAMNSVASLRAKLLAESGTADMVVMAAAVSDFRPVTRHDTKIKKTGVRISIEFEPVDDFMHEVADAVFKVGFAAETGDVELKARSKFDTHGFHVVCANPVDEPGSGFGSDTNRVTILDRDGSSHPLPCMPKTEVAHRILDHVGPAMRSHGLVHADNACRTRGRAPS